MEPTKDEWEVGEWVRHGDVTVTCIDRIPLSRAIPVERSNGRVVLALGETTGHEHAIPDPNVEHSKDGDVQYFEVKGDEGVTLTHEEHGEIDLPPGKYRVEIMREYEPTGAARGSSRQMYD